MLTLVRRVIAALGLTGLIATLFRLRGRGGVPPQTGGWRELSEAELADFLVAGETQAGDDLGGGLDAGPGDGSAGYGSSRTNGTGE